METLPEPEPEPLHEYTYPIVREIPGILRLLGPDDFIYKPTVKKYPPYQRKPYELPPFRRMPNL